MTAGTLTVIGCHGTAWYSKVISDVERSPWTHIAGIILGSTLESQGIKDKGDLYPGVWLHPPDKYKDGDNAVFITVQVPDIEAAEEEARQLIGTLYGYSDCVNGGVLELFGAQIPTDGAFTVNCSEAWTRILRAGNLNILPELTADSVTPGKLIAALTQNI
jgi:hypothetical protein